MLRTSYYMSCLETLLKSPTNPRPAFNMKAKTVLAICITAMWMLTATTGLALGSGAGAVSFTQTFHDATQTFSTPNPCSGAPGTVAITYNGVAHGTVLTSGVGAGTGWFTFTATGSFVLTPSDPSQPTFTGKFTVWDGENMNLNNFAATSILVIHGTGSDGSSLSFHDVAHFSVSASGVVITFDKPTCG